MNLHVITINPKLNLLVMKMKENILGFLSLVVEYVGAFFLHFYRISRYFLGLFCETVVTPIAAFLCYLVRKVVKATCVAIVCCFLVICLYTYLYGHDEDATRYTAGIIDNTYLLINRGFEMTGTPLPECLHKLFIFALINDGKEETL